MGRQHLSNYKVFFAFYFFFCPAAWVPIRAPPFGIPLYSPALGPHLGTPLGPLFLLKFLLRLSSTLFYNGFGTLFGRCSSWGVSRGGSLEGPGGALAGLLGINLEGLWGPNFAAPLWDPIWGPPRGPLFLLSPRRQRSSPLFLVFLAFSKLDSAFLASWAPREHPQHLKSAKSTVIIKLFACGAPKPQQL